MIDTRSSTAYTDEHALFRDQVRRLIDRDLVPNMDRWERAHLIDREQRSVVSQPSSQKGYKTWVKNSKRRYASSPERRARWGRRPLFCLSAEARGSSGAFSPGRGNRKLNSRCAPPGAGWNSLVPATLR